MKFNDWLIDQIRSKDWSQSDLSRQTGISRQAISYYINGRVPDADALRKIARALKLPPDLLFEKAGILPPSSDLTPLQRQLVELAAHAADEDLEFIVDFLERRIQKNPRPAPKPRTP